MEGCYVMILFALSCLQSPVLTCSGGLEENGCSLFNNVMPVGRISLKSHSVLTNTMSDIPLVVILRQPVPFIKPSSRFRLGSAGIIRFWRKATPCANVVQTVCPSRDVNFCQDSEILSQLYDVNECDRNPCKHEGECVNQEGGYHCDCTPQWQGINCLTDVNECDNNPCKHEGECVNQEGGYHCDCTPQWQGINCLTDVNECDSNSCKHDGECVNQEGGYHCDCTPQWQGINCTTDVNECDNNPCKHEGECVNQEGGYHCDCTPHWQGINCLTDVNECDSNPCTHEGECVNQEGGYHCDCTPQWHGINCLTDVNECDNNPCKHEGECVNQEGGYHCDCTQQWQGINCLTDVNECDNNPCKHEGECVNQEGGYHCDCTPHWQGINCLTDVNECDSNPCKHDGECVNQERGYRCYCTPQWQGKNCTTDVNECDNTPCRNNGTCLNFDGGYNCTCKPPWQGNNCETVLGPPQNVTVTDRSKTWLHIEWNPPMILMGNVIKYEIRYQAKERPYLQSFEGEENKTIFELREDAKFDKVAFNITSLDPSTVYEIQLSAFTTVGQGKRVAKTVATLVETNLIALREKDVQISTSEKGFGIRLPGLGQKYATHYVLSILHLSERKRRIMTAELNKTDNVTFFHLNVDNVYTSLNGIVWGKAIYQIYIGTQSKVREDKHVVWSDGITLKVPAWLNLVRVILATVLSAIFITGVTMLCRLQAHCQNEEEDFGSLEGQNRCLTGDPSDAEVLEDNSEFVQRYSTFLGSSVVIKESSKDDLKKALASGGTNEDITTGEGDIDNEQEFVTTLVKNASSYDKFMKQAAQRSMTISTLDNSGNDHNSASGLIPEKEHPITGKGKLDPTDKMVLKWSEDATCIVTPKKEDFINIDAVSGDSQDEGGTKRRNGESEVCPTKDCDQQQTPKIDLLLEDRECGPKRREIKNKKEDNSMRGAGPRNESTSESDDDVYEDVEDLNLILNNVDLNVNKKPGLLKSMLRVLKGGNDPRKKYTTMRGSEVNYQVKRQTEEHDFCNEDADARKECCLRKDEDLQHDASVQNVPNCHNQQRERDPYLEPDVHLEKSKAIEREDNTLSGQPYGNNDNGMLLLSFFSKSKVYHSEDIELNGVEVFVPLNERHNESNVSGIVTGSDIHDVTAANSKGSNVTPITRNSRGIDENGECELAINISHCVDIYDNVLADGNCRSKLKLNNQGNFSENLMEAELYDETSIAVPRDNGQTKGKGDDINWIGEIYDDTAVEVEQKSETTHCDQDASSNALREDSIPIVFEKTTKIPLADLGIDIYDDTSVEEGCIANTANEKVDALHVSLQQEIYGENCVESDQKYSNTVYRKLPARPKMFNNSQMRQIQDDDTHFYLDPAINKGTSEIYEMIPDEDKPFKRRQSSIFHSFKNKKLFQPRKRGTKEASLPNPPPIPPGNKFFINPFLRDISSHIYESSMETNIDDDMYEELPEGDETAEMSTEGGGDGCNNLLTDRPLNGSSEDNNI